MGEDDLQELLHLNETVIGNIMLAMPLVTAYSLGTLSVKLPLFKV